MEIKAKIKGTVVCPMAAAMKEQSRNGKVDVPMLLRKDEQRNTWFVYAEEIQPQTKVGRLESLEGIDANDLSQKVEDILTEGYSMRITGLDEKGLMVAMILVNEQHIKNAGTGESKALSEAWEKALALGHPFDQNFRETVTKFFETHGVDEELRLRIVSGYTLPVDEDGNALSLEKPASMWMPTDTPNEKGLYFSSYAAVALEQAMDGNPFIFEGPKSVGKNFLDEWITYVLGGVYYEISVDPDMAKSELYGDKVIDDTSARHLKVENAEAWLMYQHGNVNYLPEAAQHEYWSKYNETMRFVVESTEFKRWLRQKSGRRVLMVNEINYGNPTVLAVVFNRVAEDRPVRFIDVPGEGRIYIGRDCILTASMNRDYIGTQELNEAMRSRFGVIEMQPSAHIKAILKGKIEAEFGKGALPEAYYKACDDLYVYMLARAESAGNAAQYGDKAVSIRSFIRALRTIAAKGKENRKPKMLCAQLNIQLRGQCDTALERASLTDDINGKVGDL